MKRRPTVVLAALVGLIAGVVATLATTDPGDEAAGSRPATSGGDAEPTGTGESEPPVGGDAPTVLLAWTSGGLPSGFADRLATVDGIRRFAVVAGAQADLLATARADGTVVDTSTGDWAIPLDTIAIEPTSFAAFVDGEAHDTIAALSPGEAILTESSLDLRRLDVGSTMELRTGSVEVVGVVDDVSGAGSELITHIDDGARLGVATARYVLAELDPGSRTEVTRRIAGIVGQRAIRFRSPVETTWLRHGDAVAPPLLIKLAYGEFAFRDRAGRDVEIDPAWVEANIVDAEVPLLGSVRCHRAMVAPLRAALAELADENLGHLVDPAGYAGCWAPRRIETGQPLSRHAWGVAVDLNISGNPRGSFSNQDARLVDAMRDAGFTWGGRWLVPDPGHYELVPE